MRRLGRVRSYVRQTLEEFEQPFADVRALDFVIGADQFEGFSLGKRVRTLLFVLYEVGHGFARDFRWHFLKEEGHRHIQDVRQRIEAACADAIGPALVFLNLLECQPNSFSKFSLAEAKERPAMSNASTDMDINRIGFAQSAHG